MSSSTTSFIKHSEKNSPVTTSDSTTLELFLYFLSSRIDEDISQLSIDPTTKNFASLLTQANYEDILFHSHFSSLMQSNTPEGLFIFLVFCDIFHFWFRAHYGMLSLFFNIWPADFTSYFWFYFPNFIFSHFIFLMLYLSDYLTGIATLLLFSQHTWTGPPVTLSSESKLLPKSNDPNSFHAHFKTISFPETLEFPVERIEWLTIAHILLFQIIPEHCTLLHVCRN